MGAVASHVSTPPFPARGAAGASLPRWLPVLLCLLLAPSLARAQVTTVPPDTAARDTLIVPIPESGVSPDTLPPDSTLRSPGDSTSASPFPRFPNAMPIGWAFGRWELGPEQLRTYSGLTLLAFLERIPGLTVIRSSDHGYPVGLTAFGLGGGRVRLFLDGFEIDPLGFSSPDVQHLGTVDLESVVIERAPTGIRIEITPARLASGLPHSLVEAGTGAYDSKFVRGLLIRGVGGRSIIGAAYDAVSTDGGGFAAPFSLVSARATWSYALSERTALQAELHSSGFERVGRGFAENADRRTLLLRGRSEIRPGLHLDAALGRTSRDPADDDLLSIPLAATQAMVRVGLSTGASRSELSLRARDSGLRVSSAPRVDLTARTTLAPLPAVTADAELRYAPLGAGGAIGGLSGRFTARLGGPRASLFAALSRGDASLALVRDTAIEVDGDGEEGEAVPRVEPRFTAEEGRVDAVRVGGEWSRPALSVGVAGLWLPASRLTPFGAEFDRALPAVDGGAATGLEAYAFASFPGTGGLVRLEGSASYWPETGNRPFLPDLDARAALSLGGLYYDGELEPRLRVEVAHRGVMLARANGAPDPGVLTNPYTLANLLLQIRIMDVQAFGVWENVFNNRLAADIPGPPLPGVRLLYGIRWVFRN